MKKNIGLSVLFGALSVVIYSQENETKQLKEVVVSDSKFNLTQKTSGKIISRITSKELEESKGQSISEVLNRISGIQINNSTGDAGSTLGISVRGGRSRQVVVRIDGVTVSDPSAVSNEFDFKLLNLEQIESIEILKGGASVLHGSGAASAVINIRLKESNVKPISVNFNLTTGTNTNSENQKLNNIQDTNLSSGISGTLGKFTYLFNSNYQITNGLSAAESLENKNFESDPFDKIGLLAKLGYKFIDKIQYSFYANYDEANISYDSASTIDGDNSIYTKQRRIGNKINYKIKEDFLFEFTDGFSWSDRSVKGDFPGVFKSNNYTFDAFFRKKFDFGLNIATGANGSYSNLSVSRIPFGEIEITELLNNRDANFDIIDPYLNVVYNSNFGLNLNLGGRLNIHSNYGTNLIYSINPSYNIYLNEESFFQVLSSYSLAYITPSLSQLFDNSFGGANEKLKPEENQTFESGFKYNNSSKYKLSAVYFHRNQEDVIGFDPSTFANINEQNDFRTQGIEVDFFAKFLNKDALSIRANYTYTDLKDVPNSVRIAKDVVNISAGYNITKHTNVLANYKYRGRRGDNDFTSFPSSPVILEEYHLLDFQMNQKVNENFNVFARVSNIFNEEYQEVFGFETKGRNIKLGLNFNF